MNIQVLGQRGMLGSALCATLAAQKQDFYISHARLESITPDDIHASTVINCAGIVKQRQLPASEFMLVNAYGVQRLAEACDAADARLIHVSTDCVFERRGPHSENGVPDAQDIYALSKRAGEVTRTPHLTVRTSFIGKSNGLLHTLMSAPFITASRRLYWSGHTVETVARVLIMLATRDDISGLLHIPGEFMSRYELVTRLKRVYHLPVEVQLDDSYRADRRLVSNRWNALGLPPLPTFDEQLHGTA